MECKIFICVFTWIIYVNGKKKVIKYYYMYHCTNTVLKHWYKTSKCFDYSLYMVFGQLFLQDMWPKYMSAFFTSIIYINEREISWETLYYVNDYLCSMLLISIHIWWKHCPLTQLFLCSTNFFIATLSDFFCLGVWILLLWLMTGFYD